MREFCTEKFVILEDKLQVNFRNTFLNCELYHLRWKHIRKDCFNGLHEREECLEQEKPDYYKTYQLF